MKIIKDIDYYNGLKLDLYIPENNSFFTIIEFHGGGITSGDKSDIGHICEELCKHGYGVANINYSLYPNAKFPLYLKEAAQAVKYVFDHIKEYGGSKNIYLSGHSAGSYIIMMLCLNKDYLEEVGLSPLDIKGYISDAGQMSDHFNVQQYERGLDPWLQRITEFAPLYYVVPGIKTSPILLIWYTDDILCRKQQNLLFLKSLKYYYPEADVVTKELEGSHCSACEKKCDDGEHLFTKVALEWLKKEN